MATNKWTSTLTSGVSMASSWSATGASIAGATTAGIGAGLGAAIGAVGGLIVGSIFGGLAHNEEMQSIIDNSKINRKDLTQKRNRAIRSFKNIYDATRADFSTKYGEGFFDQLSTDFQKIINIQDDKTLGSILNSMQYDAKSGEITSSLTNGTLITNSDIEKFAENSFNLQDFGKEYLRVLEENLRKADTEFGLQMQSISEQEKGIISDYNSAMAEARAQLAYSFRSAFLSRQAEQISEHSALGQASIAQATSGIRQTDSGSNLTIQQEFQMDLSKVAYLTTVNYYLQQYELGEENRIRQMVSNMYQARNSIALGTKSILNSLTKDINNYNQSVVDTIDFAKDAEVAIYKENESIETAEENKWFGESDEKYIEDITGDIF